MEHEAARTKTALITGAACGLGPAYAEYFARKGFHLILTGTDRKRIMEYAGNISNRFSVQTTGLDVDLSDRKGLERMTRYLDSVNLHVFINNAPDEGLEHLRKTNSDEAKAFMALQMNTMVSLTLSAVRRMIADNEGIIVNISSERSGLPYAISSVCSSSRVFLRQFTEGLSNELSDTQIYIQAVCPGIIRPMIRMIHEFEGIRRRTENIMGIDDSAEIVNCAMHELTNGKAVYIHNGRRGILSRRTEYFAG